MSERGRSWIVAIAIFRLLKVVLLVALSTCALALRDRNVREAGERLVDWLALDRAHIYVEEFLEKLPFLTPNVLLATGIGGLVLSTVYLIEAYGLLRGRSWAEWLTIVGTSVFIPLEVYEIVDEATELKVATLVVNVAIVAYLVHRRLSGSKGPGARARTKGERWASTIETT